MPTHSVATTATGAGLAEGQRRAPLDGRRVQVAIIGGGILGAAVAAELAQRGYSCLLVERADFAHGTTGRSTRLIHGGLRYLAMFDFGLVREGLRERAWQLREMPHLVQPLSLMLPNYGQPMWRRARVRLGLTLYDLLSPWGSLPRHRHHSSLKALEVVPSLQPNGLQSADVFWDGQVELPERLVVEILRRAEESGAVVRNHVAAIGLVRKAGRVSGVELLDTHTGEQASVATDVVINAAGPWADETLRSIGVVREPLLRLSQGVHLVYPRLADQGIAVEHPEDRRLCFILPWQGWTLVGTTDTDVDGSPERAAVRPADVDYLHKLVEALFPAPPRAMWGVVGVRSLARGGSADGLPQSVSRRHILFDHSRDEAAGLFTVAGGKLTAWRATGQHVADELHRRVESIKPAAPRSTRLRPLADPADDQSRDRLWRLYGPRASEVRAWMAADPWWAEPLLASEDALRAEVAHAIASEWALTLADIVLRRLALGFGPDLGYQAALAVADICRSRFGWSNARVQRELADFAAQNDERRLPDGRRPG